jgi:hypothetical protein
MDDREQLPAPTGADEHLGALTGATGSLTPDDPDGEFVPAETREVNDAYREEQRLPPAPTGRVPSADRDAPRLGGDERRDPEDEHL